MPCHILKVFECKMNCGAVEEMKKTKIYNDNKLKLKISQETIDLSKQDVCLTSKSQTLIDI